MVRQFMQSLINMDKKKRQDVNLAAYLPIALITLFIWGLLVTILGYFFTRKKLPIRLFLLPYDSGRTFR